MGVGSTSNPQHACVHCAQHGKDMGPRRFLEEHDDASTLNTSKTCRTPRLRVIHTTHVATEVDQGLRMFMTMLVAIRARSHRGVGLGPPRGLVENAQQIPSHIAERLTEND